MGSPQYPQPATDRWNLNLPLLIGVVFVFLIGVVIWVIAATGDDDPAMVATTDATNPTTSVESTSTTTSTTTTTMPPTTPPSTTPAPMPDATAITSTTVAPATTPAPPPPPPPPTTQAPKPPPPPPAPTTTRPTVPPTTAAGADPDAVPGDLAIEGYPMQAPPCNDSYITVIASAVGSDVAAEGIRAYLEDHSGSNYLRTDQTCPSLTQSMDGEPIYVVFFGPFTVAGDACAARSRGTDGAYVRQLSESVGPNHGVTCPE